MTAALSLQLVAAWRSTSWVEIVAALLAVLYLLLAIKERRSCWVAAFVSSWLYVWVLFGARLYMESVLNAFYAAMAVYGYWQWTRSRDAAGPRGSDLRGSDPRGSDLRGSDLRGSGGREPGLRISHWPMSRHALGLLAVICLSAVSSIFLRRFTPAAWPFVDSMVTWASVFATFLVARKVYENWHWWFIIDSLSLCLYFTRRLYLTMLLFGIYLLMIVIGMREWRRSLQSIPRGAQRA